MSNALEVLYRLVGLIAVWVLGITVTIHLLAHLFGVLVDTFDKTALVISAVRRERLRRLQEEIDREVAERGKTGHSIIALPLLFMLISAASADGAGRYAEAARRARDITNQQLGIAPASTGADDWYDHIVHEVGHPPVVYEIHSPTAVKAEVTYLHDEGGGEVTDRIGAVITRQLEQFVSDHAERGDRYLYGDWRIVVRDAEVGELPRRWPKEYERWRTMRRIEQDQYREEDCAGAGDEFDCENCDENELCWYCCEGVQDGQ